MRRRQGDNDPSTYSMRRQAERIGQATKHESARQLPAILGGRDVTGEVERLLVEHAFGDENMASQPPVGSTSRSPSLARLFHRSRCGH